RNEPGAGMKVLVAALHFFPDRPDGSAQLAWGHARYLAESGHEVFLLALSASAGAPELERRNGVTVLRSSVPALAAFDPRRIGGHGRAIEPILRRHLPGGVDVVCGHTLLTMLPAIALMGSRPFVSYSIHSPVRDEYQASARLTPGTADPPPLRFHDGVLGVHARPNSADSRADDRKTR